MNRKIVLVLVAGLIGALGLVGLGCEMCCNSSQGSGSITIADPTPGGGIHKATFSYRVECVGSYSDAPDAVRTVKGRLEYQDHRPWKNGAGNLASVSIHGSVDNVALVEDEVCTQNNNVAIFTGTYSPQPKTLGEGGRFTIMVEDKGKPGPSPEDTFSMKLEGGVFADYAVGGVLAGGNIKAL